MTTTIEIKGGIRGNYLLRSAIHDGYCQEEKLGAGFLLTFSSKSNALKALTNARKYPRAERYCFEWSKISISYDASRAFIVNQ